MNATAVYFNDPLDPQRSLQLNNRFWREERFSRLDDLRAADDDINNERWASLRKTIKPVKAMLPRQYHAAFLRHLAYSITYRRRFEPIRFTLKLSDEFLDANRYNGANSEHYDVGRNVDELYPAMEMAHAVYRKNYGLDGLYSRYQVRYVNSNNVRTVKEVTRYGAFSDFHLDQRADFTCIIYLSDVKPENGCFSYIDGTSSLDKSHLLRALHSVVSFDMGLPNPDQVGHLPLELRGGIGMGNFIDDEKHDRLSASKVDFVGRAGDGIMFNGFDTVHRGGKPLVGERHAIFISTAGYARMRVKRVLLQTLASIWL
jgi:hypothetical protein